MSSLSHQDSSYNNEDNSCERVAVDHDPGQGVQVDHKLSDVTPIDSSSKEASCPDGWNGDDKERSAYKRTVGDRERSPHERNGGDRERSPHDINGGDRERSPHERNGGDRERSPYERRGGDRERSPYERRGGDRERSPYERSRPDARKGSDTNRRTESDGHQRRPSGRTDAAGADDFRAIRDRKLEVCREYIHNRCRRSDFECRYAHPPSHIEVQEGFVTCCFDYSKGRCSRSKCRFFHPPPHLMPEGATMPHLGMNFGRSLPPYLASAIAAYMSGSSGGSNYSGGRSNSRNVDKVEVCREFMNDRCQREECRYAHPPGNMRCDNNCVTACMDFVNGNCTRETCRYFHPPSHILQRIQDMISTSQGPRRRPISKDSEDTRSERRSSRDEKRNDESSDGRDVGEKNVTY